MKISLDAAMRARDVSQPTAVDEAAAASMAEAQDRTQPGADPAGQITEPTPVPGPSGVTGGRGRPAPPRRPRPVRRTAPRASSGDA